ncbi:hypothetical protein [Streptomyces boluensis]|uniref:Uncharacterized protein n=1 Tax=Streptomyces boluensis TaxID=1775135 RepID=A0A964UR33_9ACTN|nr:hypothetical protein [Streptomyces boluensis]NBE52921.1 hypothetical protein [Streptomyces boluensis]
MSPWPSTPLLRAAVEGRRGGPGRSPEAAWWNDRAALTDGRDGTRRPPGRTGGGDELAGSARPKRRRAAAPALTVQPRTARPRMARERKDGGRRKRAWWPGVAAFGLVAGIAGQFLWAAPVWAALAPSWPGQGYGLAVTVGLLLPGVIAAAAMTGLWSKRHASAGAVGPALGSGAASVVCFAASVFLIGVMVGSVKPKARHREADCSMSGGACWIGEHYPWAWLLGLLVIPVGILLAMWVNGRFGSRTPNGPTATSGEGPGAEA